MNILFLTISPKKAQKMNRDIALAFFNHGHNVYIVCPDDEENSVNGDFVNIEGMNYLFVKSGDAVGKIGIVKKVKNFLLTDSIYKNALKKATIPDGIDLVLYSTPPITLVNTIIWAKKKFGAKSYLMLKDIFPQNAVDMGMMKKNGIMSVAYKYFRKKEKKLYVNSDFIGCMSKANKKYILKHNSELNENKVGLCVNSYACEPLLQIDRKEVRNEFDLPQDKIIFLYGGNLGKPQGLQYFVDVMKANKNKQDRFFLICGGGNDQKKIEDFIEKEKPDNVRYVSMLSPYDFDRVSRASDIGLIFLDNRFTIPNFPSRMLSIMINQMPILAATDKNTDVGDVIAQGDMGWWCESREVSDFCKFIDDICKNPSVIEEKGKNARIHYENNYTTQVAYNQIVEGLNKIGLEI